MGILVRLSSQKWTDFVPWRLDNFRYQLQSLSPHSTSLVYGTTNQLCCV